MIPHLHLPHHLQPLESQTHLNASLHPNALTLHDELHHLNLDWNSRSHRKGILAVPSPEYLATSEITDRTDGSDLEKNQLSAAISPGSTSSPSDKPTNNKSWNIKRQPIRWIGFDYFDISWWVAILFTVGSIFWCINGILFFVYFTNDAIAFTNTESATAFLGGTFFIVGAWLGWVESLNPTLDMSFGWEIDDLTHTLIEPRHAKNSLGRGRRHFGRHHNESAIASKPNTDLASKEDLPSTSNSGGQGTVEGTRQNWRWYGRDPSLAYIANTIQLFGASIFWISTICGLPGILPLAGGKGGPEQGARVEGLWVGLYWVTQVIGAPCFVIAGAMFCIEVQKKWWRPNIFNIGWQIGFWNLIGGFGFWFCGIFGIWRQTSISDPTLYQKWGSAFSTFWGSWAFLIGSYIQLWEGINKRS